MAYSTALTYSYLNETIAGRRMWVFTVYEEDAEATSEWNTNTVGGTGIGPLPSVCTLYSYRADLTSNGVGTAVTIQPIVGNATGVAGKDRIQQNSPAAAVVRNIDPSQRVVLDLPTGVMYVRSTPNAGNDATIYSTWVIVEGLD